MDATRANESRNGFRPQFKHITDDPAFAVPTRYMDAFRRLGYGLLKAYRGGDGRVYWVAPCYSSCDLKTAYRLRLNDAGELMGGCKNGCNNLAVVEHIGVGLHDLRDFGETGPPPGSAAADREAGFEFLSLSTMKAKPFKWLVPGRIPESTLQVFGSYGGVGKSTLVRSIIAGVTTGRPCFGLQYDPGPAGNVLLVAAEDDYSSVVIPHLLAEGADLDRVSLVYCLKTEGKDKTLRMHLTPDQIPALGDYISGMTEPPKLLVIDPIASIIGRGELNEARASEVRKVLDPLSDMAQQTGMSVLVLAHLNKTAGGSAANRIAGSRAFVDAVRLVYCLEVDKEDEELRYVMPVKANIPGVTRAAATFRLKHVGDDMARHLRHHPAVADLPDEDYRQLAKHLNRVSFGQDADVRADEVMNGTSKNSAKKVEQCVAWLRVFLKDYAYPSTEIQTAAAKEQQFSKATVIRAKAELKDEGLTSEKDGKGGWWCGFGHFAQWKRRPEPAHDAKPSEPCESCEPCAPCSSSSLFEREEREEEAQEEQDSQEAQGTQGKQPTSRTATEHTLEETGAASVRVFELAKELGVESKLLLDLCRKLKFAEVKNQLKALTPDQAAALRKRVSA